MKKKKGIKLKYAITIRNNGPSCAATIRTSGQSTSAKILPVVNGQ